MPLASIGRGAPQKVKASLGVIFCSWFAARWSKSWLPLSMAVRAEECLLCSRGGEDEPRLWIGDGGARPATAQQFPYNLDLDDHFVAHIQ